jgi:uncharacterized repeat protein (TIGR04076 family)
LPVRIVVTGGKCQAGAHPVGQEFIVEGATPCGMCADLWNTIAPYVMTLRHGGDLPWAERKGMVEIRCPDPKGIAVLLERIERE